MYQPLFRRFLIFSILIILIKPAFSQSNYISGSIIDLNGDTIPGFIDFKNWSVNPDRIKFKENPEEKAKVYTPLHIQEFLVQGAHFTSAIVDIELSIMNESRLMDDNALHFKKDTVFLLALIEV